MFLSTEVHVPISGKLLLCLSHERIQSCLDVRQALTDMLHENL